MTAHPPPPGDQVMAKEMSGDVLDELERLEREATTGPWEAYPAICCPDVGGLITGNRPVCQADTKRPGHALAIGDAELIAALRNAAPSLLSSARQVERLKHAVFEMRCALNGLTMAHLSQCFHGVEVICTCGAVEQNRRIRQTLETVASLLADGADGKGNENK